MPPKTDTKPDAKSAKAARQVSTRAQIERIFGIVALIQNREAATVSDLCAHFEVNRRTILRDIQFLRERLGVEMEFDHQAKRYVVDSKFTHIPPLELSETDFLLLSYLQQCIAPHADTDIGKVMIKSFDRMFGLLTGSKKWKEFSKSVVFRFDISSCASAKNEVKTFNVLQRAINGPKVGAAKEVRFSYKGQKKPATIRTVEPCLMTMHHGRWYLYGLDVAKKALVSFAFARMESVEMTGRTFVPNEAVHNARKLLRNSFGVMISTTPPVDVVLEFEKEVAQRVKETVWHPLQKLEDLSGSRVQLTLPLSETLEVRPWILSWGPYVKVVAPQDLADEVAGIALRIADRYS